MKMLSGAEWNTLKEAVYTWLTLIANDDTGVTGEALDLTLNAGEILQIKKEELDEILKRG